MNDNTATAGSLPLADSLLVRLLQRVNQIDDALVQNLTESNVGDISPEQFVIRSGLMDEREIATAYAEHYLLPLFDPPTDSPLPVNPSAAATLPASFCRQHQIAPLSDDGNTIEVALFAPDCLRLADEVRMITGNQMQPFFATPTVIRRLLSVLYPESELAPKKCATGLATISGVTELRAQSKPTQWTAHLPDSVRCPPIADEATKEYVQHLFEHALRCGGTELHLEPFEQLCRTRIRINGELQEYESVSRDSFEQIVHRIKTLSEMETLECTLPQEGVIRQSCGGQRHIVRVTTCPTLHGEKIMMRLGSSDYKLPNLDDLGLDREQEAQLRQAMLGRSGLILVTGPLGSGKSTTLYACLRERDRQASNIYTVESQVAFPVEGVNQIEIASHKQIRLAAAVRACLRQDPDVLMAGEVGDHDTADACFTAAARDCFVLAGFESCETLEVFNRIRDMGIDPETVARSLRAIVAQRLLPRLCPHCKEPTQLDSRTATFHKLDVRTAVFQAVGCDQCDQSGYWGHAAAFELLVITPELKEMILRRESFKAMKLSAQSAGATTLADGARQLVVEGKVSLEDACRVLGCRCLSH